MLTEIKDNNTKTIFTYTTGGLVLTKKNYKNSTVQSSFAYTYYPNGNVKTETTKSGKVTTYQYDDLGRLISEAVTGTSNNYTITYTYDARGNRATKTIGNSTVTYTYDLNNRLTQSTENGITLYTYDNNGNTLTVINGTNTATYTYDLWNRQKSYTPDGVLTTQTTYRPDGMRHSIGTTKHIWDGGNIVGDYAGTSYTKYFRTYWLIFTQTGTTKKYYNSNGHGDIIALTNTSGTVTKNYEYNAFGEETNPAATDNNPFRYCGEYFDKVSGTLYLRARNYNASIGRFTQQDGWEYEDIYNPLTLNLYTYCWNTPVNGLDPSGHLFGWLKKVVKGVGALFNAAGHALGKAAVWVGSVFGNILVDIEDAINAIRSLFGKDEIHFNESALSKIRNITVCTKLITGRPISALITQSVLGNTENAYLYKKIVRDNKKVYVPINNDGSYDISSNVYVPREERLIYAYSITGEKSYNEKVARVYSEYSIHMYAYLILDGFKNKTELFNKINSLTNGLLEEKINEYLAQAESANINVGSWDSRFFVDLGTWVFELLGG